ncbi:hypothetical protein HAX54_014323 [Datura stramonium]|uniref:Uncharacterized protein n=1 Tax=Datura stramonium TaxID=4076 RepID=A0ABS8TPS8_DATST|nr:hypothetical protein [Datura stramonium]
MVRVCSAFWSCCCSPVPATGNSEERGREWGESGGCRFGGGRKMREGREEENPAALRRYRCLRRREGGEAQGFGGGFAGMEVWKERKRGEREEQGRPGGFRRFSGGGW